MSPNSLLMLSTYGDRKCEKNNAIIVISTGSISLWKVYIKFYWPYEIFITGPLQSAKLYQEVRASADPEKNSQYHYETPYVVHLQNRTELALPQPLFTFKHPLSGKIDNSRFFISMPTLYMKSMKTLAWSFILFSNFDV